MLRPNLKTLVFAIALMPAMVSAQQTSPFTTESILRYLEQDYNIKPGRGFKNVQLGYTFAAVNKIWGKPKSVEQFPLFGLNKKWRYSAGETQIILVGNKQVESIEVIGDFTSPFQTTEGVRFGMSPQQIISVYGRPNRAKGLTYFNYDRRGVEFAMENGVLRALRVFFPGSTK